MYEKVLIVEDQFIEANDLQLMLGKAGYHVCGIANSVQKAKEMIEKERPDLVLLDIFLKGKLTGIDLARQLKEDQTAFVYLSANSNEEVLAAAKATQPDGFLVKPFREKDVLVTLEIARYRHEQTVRSGHRQEAQLQKQLSRIAEEDTGPDQKLLKTIMALQSFIPFEYMTAGFKMPGQPPHTHSGFLRITFDEYQVIGPKELMIITKLKMHEISALEKTGPVEIMPVWYNEEAFITLSRSYPIVGLIADTFQVRSYLVLPMPLASGETGIFSFYSRRPDAYHADHIAFFSRLQRALTRAVQQVIPSTTNESSGSAIANSDVPATSTPSFTPGFEGIIGSSHLLLNVFDHVTRVAPSDTSVLILGESGTGKEKIAESIHQLSPRKKNAFIKVNCAAFPTTLIESELFGHEKGAFTGATEKRIGKFEAAADGTIFLDEIGEIPVELQVKLLRVLQEKEIERIGSKSIKKIDVRIIAATNRNLEKEVAEGRFRLDLYYRLNVFPILLPALRDRKDDIPVLISHFISYYNRKAGRKITGVSDKVMKNLTAYHWPGNIRELEHLIERSVLLAKGSILDDVPLPNLPNLQDAKGMNAVNAHPGSKVKTIHENERDHIVEVLKKCYGRIWGPGGAAELLNVPPTTLTSKMKKLGIKRENIV